VSDYTNLSASRRTVNLLADDERAAVTLQAG